MFDAEHNQQRTAKKGTNPKCDQVGNNLPWLTQSGNHEECKPGKGGNATDGRAENEHKGNANRNRRWLKVTGDREGDGQQKRHAGKDNQC